MYIIEGKSNHFDSPLWFVRGKIIDSQMNKNSRRKMKGLDEVSDFTRPSPFLSIGWVLFSVKKKKFTKKMCQKIRIQQKINIWISLNC